MGVMQIFDTVLNGFRPLKETDLAGGGGGGGGAATVADGADVAQGAVADAAVAAGASGTLSAKLRAISRDIGAMLLQTGYSAQPSVTRPANTTAYTAGDVVGGAIEFPAAGPSGGHALITTAGLQYQVAAIPSGMSSFRLHLYDVTPPSALADNAAWDLPSGDRAAYLGFVDLGSVADLVSTLYAQVDGVQKLAKLATGSTSLWGYLVTTGAYTPAANSETLRLSLRSVGA